MINKFGTGFGIATAIYGIAFGILLWISPFPSPQILPKAQINAISFDNEEITDFQQVVQAPRLISVNGDSVNVPSEWSVWICIYSEEAQRYYPQQEPLSNNGEWQCKDISLGMETDSQVGNNFFVCLVIADSDANKKLSENANYIFTGLKELPERSVVCDQIKVIRAK